MSIKIRHTTEEFTDRRGAISRIVDQDKFQIRSVLKITSKAGTVRSNHYHKKDSHYIYVESGKCEYSEKPAHVKGAKLQSAVLVPGDVVLSEPGVIHAVKFLEDSVLYAYTTEGRDQQAYEADTVRVTIVPEEHAFKLDYCRLCKSTKLKKVLDLGKTALANSFLTRDQLVNEELTFPLALNFCTNCCQLQTTHVVDPDLLFKDYVWVSSTSPVTVAHFEDYARSAFAKLKLTKGDLVVEMGSNDGVLLKPFKALGAKVLGVDPAQNIAERTNKAGILTIPQYFDSSVAGKIVDEHGKAKLLIGNNVFAHIHDLDEVLRAADTLLDTDGVFIIEFPYLVDFLKKNLFDIVYHEHLSYLAIKPLDQYFKAHNMQIFSVLKTPVHGGSVRLFVKRIVSKWPIDRSVTEFKRLETKEGLSKLQTYLGFASHVKQNKKELTKLVRDLKKQNKKIAAYGAPAKCTTLMTYFGIDNNVLDYIVDDSPYKHKLYTPGTNVPVVSPSLLTELPPDFLIILAWNFAESIMAKPVARQFAENGGKFIVPVPTPTVV